MEKFLIASLGAGLLVACTTVPSPDEEEYRVREPAGECDASDTGDLIGQRADEGMGAILLERTGAQRLRWAAPGTALTRDFRRDRLTVYYNNDMIIERIACG